MDNFITLLGVSGENLGSAPGVGAPKSGKGRTIPLTADILETPAGLGLVWGR